MKHPKPTLQKKTGKMLKTKTEDIAKGFLFKKKTSVNHGKNQDS